MDQYDDYDDYDVFECPNCGALHDGTTTGTEYCPDCDDDTLDKRRRLWPRARP